MSTVYSRDRVGQFCHGSGDYEVKLFCSDWIWYGHLGQNWSKKNPRLVGMKCVSTQLNVHLSLCILRLQPERIVLKSVWPHHVHQNNRQSTTEPVTENYRVVPECSTLQAQRETWAMHPGNCSKKNRSREISWRKKESLQPSPLWHVVPLTRTWKINVSTWGRRSHGQM